ncbi:MAG: S8 family serine peptidase [Deltaproteobacteria bacterium]|nr:S8 family serine peptidase [Deltaproteobacteria bacterium]
MRAIRLSTACALLALCAQASAGEVNPYLRLLERSDRLQQAFRPWRLTVLGPARDLDAAPEVPALVRSRDREATADWLARQGGHSGARIGADLLCVRAAPDVLLRLAERPEVERVEALPPHTARLDRSRPDVGADRLEAGFELDGWIDAQGTPLPVDGLGVVAGVVDTGLDFEHEDFLDEAGDTRALMIWDRAFASGDPPPDRSSGVLCQRKDGTLMATDGEDSLVCNSIDFIGHGTHVGATMASSGDPYRGMAPASELIAVTLSVDFAEVADATSWVFDHAEALGRPAVVNLSLGTHYGPHDGTSLESSAFTELVGPGRIIVAAAGNEGDYPIHLGYDPAGSTGKTHFEVFAGLEVNAALLTLWADGDAELEIAVGVDKQDEQVALSAFVPLGAAPAQETLSDDGRTLGRVTFVPAGEKNADNGKWNVDIEVAPSDDTFSGNPDGYAWFIMLRGQGSFDAWSAAATAFTYPALFSTSTEEGHTPGDSQKTVGMPAVASGVVAVGAYVTRDRWTDSDGVEQIDEHAEVGDIAFFSSLGPSAEPELTGHKPWIAAPGSHIIAARSHTSGALQEGVLVGEKDNEKHIVMQGTSMACPHAAGIVALMLQIDPTLEPDEVREILARTARRDAYTGDELPDFTWGHGKADAYEAIAFMLGVGVCESDAECAEGHHCDGAQGRCLADEGGCGCAGTGGARSDLWLLLAACLGLLLSASSRKGW